MYVCKTYLANDEIFHIVNPPIILLFSKNWVAGLSNEDNSTSDLTDVVSVVRGTHRWSCQTRTDYYVLTNASTKTLVNW